jgi:hypothetical protein
MLPKLLAMVLCLTCLPLPALAKTLTLNEGMPVELVLRQEINSTTSSEGEIVSFDVAEDVQAADKTLLIKAGTPAFGQLSRLEKQGAFGKPGQLLLRLDQSRGWQQGIFTGRGQPFRPRETWGRGGVTYCQPGGVLAFSLFCL